MEETVNNDKELHSEDMQDIIGAPPKWLYRWGMSLILLVLLICLGISVFFDYPDAIHTTLKIRSVLPPYSISCNGTGRLIKILAKNNQMVKKGQNLAYVECNQEKFILKSPESGILNYAGIIHENLNIKNNQPIFYIQRASNNFYGELTVPKNSIQKVKQGQQVIVSLQRISDEAYIEGNINYITQDTSKNSDYVAEVDFKFKKNKPLNLNLLKDGSVTDAKIVTSRMSIFRRLMQGFIKI